MSKNTYDNAFEYFAYLCERFIVNLAIAIISIHRPNDFEFNGLAKS